MATSKTPSSSRNSVLIDFALQGGGAHGAFTWGALDRLLKESWLQTCNKCNGRKSAAPMEKWNGRPRDKPIKGKYGEPQGLGKGMAESVDLVYCSAAGHRL